MPLRRNECQTCGFHFRTLEETASADTPLCPACGSRKTKRLLPRFAVQFKGNGYYKTDHARRDREPGEGRGTDRETVSTSSKSETNG